MKTDYTDIELKAYKQGQKDLLKEIEERLVVLPGLKYYRAISIQAWGKLKRRFE